MGAPYVISINSVSGGGKTALSELLHESLRSSALFRFDDFDDSNVYPEDYYEWSMRGSDVSEFDCPGMQEAVVKEIKRGKVEYIVMDYPFGRDHHRFTDMIDLSVFVDTPLDVAMARRILRDYPDSSETPSDIVLKNLHKDLDYYVRKARYPYLSTYSRKGSCDLVLDGWMPLEALRREVLGKVREDQDADEDSVPAAT